MRNIMGKLKKRFLINTVANSNNLPFAMTANVLGIPFPLLEGNACQHLTLGNCPALVGNTFTFRLAYLVTDILPPVWNHSRSSTLFFLIFIPFYRWAQSSPQPFGMILAMSEFVFKLTSIPVHLPVMFQKILSIKMYSMNIKMWF